MAPCVRDVLDDASRGMPSHEICPNKLVLLSHARQGSLSELCRPWKLAVRGGHKMASHPKSATCPMFQPLLLESQSVVGSWVMRLLRRKMISLSNLHTRWWERWISEHQNTKHGSGFFPSDKCLTYQAQPARSLRGRWMRDQLRLVCGQILTPRSREEWSQPSHFLNISVKSRVTT